MIIIVSGYNPVRYISIAALERRECAHISMGPKPNFPLLRIWTVALKFVRIPGEVIVNLFSFLIHESLT